SNAKFDNITQVWLNGDHYKWRAMRTNGVDEKYITGDASDKEKFIKWAETVPYTLRNPLYHWTHLELRRYFGITELLTKDSAERIYNQTAEMLQSDEFSVRGLLKKMNVEVICTTDDPLDDLNQHQSFLKENESFKMIPAFRPDKAMEADDIPALNNYIDKLAGIVKTELKTFESYKNAIKERHDYFAENGCKLSDHGLEEIYAEDFTNQEIEVIFQKIRANGQLSRLENHKFKSAMLVYFAQLDHQKGWVQQYHLGALRNNNKRMLRVNGPDTGWDSIGDFSQAQALSKFLDRLDNNDQLTKTIVYNLNPADNEVMATMIGNFNDGSVA